MEMFNNILNNSTDKRIIEFKMIMKEREKLQDVKKLKYMCPKILKKSEVNDLYNKTKELFKLKRKKIFNFKESNYKNIAKYIEDVIDISITEYKILKRKINSINSKMKETIEKKEKADYEKYKEDVEKGKIEEKLKEKERLEDYRKNQEEMKNYNKEVLRYDENSNEEKYTCSVCDIKIDQSKCLTYEQLDVKKGHFKLKLHIDNFNKNVNIKTSKSVGDKFIDIIFDFKKLHNTHIYEDFYLKKIMKK